MHFKVDFVFEFAQRASHFALIQLMVKVHLLRLRSVAIAAPVFFVSMMDGSIMLHVLLIYPKMLALFYLY